ncbi:hypothetical protein BS17DRAFT_86520 [Gyrodon lividus]|nr:hypothetical protein BS17DRAFT_86520 [Gyrodon lividus]
MYCFQKRRRFAVLLSFSCRNTHRQSFQLHWRSPSNSKSLTRRSERPEALNELTDRAIPIAGTFSHVLHSDKDRFKFTGTCTGIALFGSRSVCFELDHFRISFLTAGNRTPYQPSPADYEAMSENANGALDGPYAYDHHIVVTDHETLRRSGLVDVIFIPAYNVKQPGDAKKGIEIILDVLTRTRLRVKVS